MIALNTAADSGKIRKILCPECRSRICDVIVPEWEKCRHKYRVIFDGNSEYLFSIKCQKCGQVIGLGITQ